MCEPVLLTSHQLQNNSTQLFTQAGMLSQAICGKNSPTEDEEKSKLSFFHFFSLGSSRLGEERSGVGEEDKSEWSSGPDCQPE